MKTSVNFNGVVQDKIFNSLSEYRQNTEDVITEPYTINIPIEKDPFAPKTFAYVPIHIETETEFENIPRLETPFMFNNEPHVVIDLAEIYAVVEGLIADPDKPTVALFDMTYPFCGTPVMVNGEKKPADVVGVTINVYFHESGVIRVWYTADVDGYRVVSDVIAILRNVNYVCGKVRFPGKKIDSPVERDERTLFEFIDIRNQLVYALLNAKAVIVDSTALTFPEYDEGDDTFLFAWMTAEGDRVEMKVSAEDLGSATLLGNGTIRTIDTEGNSVTIQFLTANDDLFF